MLVIIAVASTMGSFRKNALRLIRPVPWKAMTDGAKPLMFEHPVRLAASPVRDLWPAAVENFADRPK
jgi:hypothetical protein